MTPEQGRTLEHIRNDHIEKMIEKRRHRAYLHQRLLKRGPIYDDRANSGPAYRKSIWPEGKVSKPGRMG
jgi:hypothetical protein